MLFTKDHLADRTYDALPKAPLCFDIVMALGVPVVPEEQRMANVCLFPSTGGKGSNLSSIGVTSISSIVMDSAGCLRIVTIVVSNSNGAALIFSYSSPSQNIKRRLLRPMYFLITSSS